MDIGLLAVGVGLVTAFALITLTFYIREKRTGRRVYYLKEATTLGMLTGVTNIMVSGPEFDVFGLGPTVILRFTLASWLLVFGGLGLFFASMRTVTPDWRVVSLACILGAASIVAGFGGLLIPGVAGNPMVLIWKLGYALYACLVFGYGTRVYWLANRMLPETRSLVLSLAIGTIFVTYVLNIFIYDVPNYLGFQVVPGLNLEMVLDLFRILAMLVMVVVLLTDMEYFYRIPVRIYSIAVNSSAGMNLYNYSPEPTPIDPNLFSGALTAISLVMRESMGSTEGSVRQIITGDRVVLVESREDCGFCVAAVVGRATRFIVRSVQVFADMLAEEYGEVLKRDTFASDMLQNVELMMLTAFPFLKAAMA